MRLTITVFAALVVAFLVPPSIGAGEKGAPVSANYVAEPGPLSMLELQADTGTPFMAEATAGGIVAIGVMGAPYEAVPVPTCLPGEALTVFVGDQVFLFANEPDWLWD